MEKYMQGLYEKIERERDKLTCLVNQTLKENQPIGVNDMILAQNRKLNLLIGKLENQKKSGEHE